MNPHLLQMLQCQIWWFETGIRGIKQIYNFKRRTVSHFRPEESSAIIVRRTSTHRRLFAAYTFVLWHFGQSLPTASSAREVTLTGHPILHHENIPFCERVFLGVVIISPQR